MTLSCGVRFVWIQMPPPGHMYQFILCGRVAEEGKVTDPVMRFSVCEICSTCVWGPESSVFILLFSEFYRKLNVAL